MQIDNWSSLLLEKYYIFNVVEGHFPHLLFMINKINMLNVKCLDSQYCSVGKGGGGGGLGGRSSFQKSKWKMFWQWL